MISTDSTTASEQNVVSFRCSHHKQLYFIHLHPYMCASRPPAAQSLPHETCRGVGWQIPLSQETGSSSFHCLCPTSHTATSSPSSWYNTNWHSAAFPITPTEKEKVFTALEKGTPHSNEKSAGSARNVQGSHHSA